MKRSHKAEEILSSSDSEIDALSKEVQVLMQ